ncbi:hypothetical protein BJY04DRAFT_181641 [Aspergillus karnatakaensis]|uniref:uncharacterized protein n=1 Tax=Aspergillus karnatakaensis TaxID=1810916 RepID=UPI003CCE27EE
MGEIEMLSRTIAGYIIELCSYIALASVVARSQSIKSANQPSPHDPRRELQY